jgi:hypothetical protein
VRQRTLTPEIRDVTILWRQRDLTPKIRNVTIFGRQRTLTPKIRDVTILWRQSFLKPHPGRQSFRTPGRRKVRASEHPGVRSGPLATFPTRRKPGENPARTLGRPGEVPVRARRIPGRTRSGLAGPGGARPLSRIRPAFRGQNPASARPFCPLKPGWIREAPGGVLPEASAGRRRGAARRRPRIRMRIRRSVGGTTLHSPILQTANVLRSENGRRMGTRARRSPRPGRFPSLFPRFAPAFPPEKPGPGPGGPRRSQGFQPGSGPG